MTNHWNDIDNASCVIVMGANPAENHPACFAHINAARFGAKNARLIVIDPRQTRTARQCDPNRDEFYVRIRPGTDIAFLNGLMKWIMDNAVAQQYNPTVMNRMIDWHNGWMGVGDKAPNSTATRGFIADAYANVNLDAAAFQAGTFNGTSTSGVFDNGRAWPKYTDTRLKVNAAGNDYKRGTFVSGANTFSNMPEVAHDIDDPDCVYQKLYAHVKPYDLATVAGICGCTEQEIVRVAKAFVDNSRFASSDFGDAIAKPQNADYKATTFLYAMGQTQHTYGSQNIKGIAEIMTLMGNMGRAGGGVNALRGIHNVQGSTDFGLLYDSIIGYSGNPPTGTMSDDDEYIHYQDGLFGTRVLDSHKTGVSGGVNCLTSGGVAGLGLQQRGFHNMTQEWFGTGAVPAAGMGKLYSLWPKGNGYQHIEAFRRMVTGDIKAAVVWGQNPAVTEPNQSSVRKGLENLELLVVTDLFETETAACSRKDGAPTYLIPACSHVEEAGSVTNSGRWLQWREQARQPVGNSKTDLELLLRFAYALDQANAFRHIKQVWSDLSVLPAGVTVADPGGAYDTLYKRNYLWSPADSVHFDDFEGQIKRWKPGATAPTAAFTAKGSEVIAEAVFKEICSPLNRADTLSGGTMWIYSGNNAESAYNTSTADNTATGGSEGNGVWALENRAKSRNSTRTGGTTVAEANASHYPRWGWAWLLNRRVFYNNSEVLADRADTFVAPGYLACLFTLDTNDMADWAGPLAYRKYKKFNDRPSTVAWDVNGLDPKAGTENSAHWLRDGDGVIVRDGAGKAVSLAGRFSAHCEPYESPKPSPTNWGRNTGRGVPLLFETGSDGGYEVTPVGAVADYPLVLTTIRCVEHFQGGPITRNNAYNVEAEPEPWIEINPIDARKYGIANGDYVNVITARSNSAGPTALNPGRVNQQNNRCADDAMAPAANWNKGFVARVDNSIAAYQRVAPGVVAIPWHWGDRGLGQGSRANDLCIDAWDANTMIPEYKACLCKIEKA